MFKPLENLLDKHGESLVDALLGIQNKLDDVIENTKAKMQYDEFVTHNGRANTQGGDTATIELKASAGFAWKVTQLAVTCAEGGRCAVYIGAVSDDNLIDFISPASIAAKSGEYYVPRGAAIIFHFYEQPENQDCTVNLQAEQLAQKPFQEAATGVANTSL